MPVAGALWNRRARVEASRVGGGRARRLGPTGKDTNKAFYGQAASAQKRERARGAREVSTQVSRSSGYARTAVAECDCPACGASGILSGEHIRIGEPRVGEDAIEQSVVKLPTQFECPTCGLSITGYEALEVAGLGGQFTVEIAEDPVSFYGIEHDVSDSDIAAYLHDEYGND